MQPFLKKHYNLISNLFLKCGIHSVSMDDIAFSTHTSKKTIYKEYKCKNELVREFFILDYLQFKQQLHFLEKANSNAITRTVKLYFLIHKKVILINSSVLFDLKKYHPDLFTETIVSHRRDIKDTFFSVLTLGKSEDLFLQNIDSDSIANLITLIIESSVYSLLALNKNEWSFHPNHFLDFHFRGICTPLGLGKWETQKQGLLTRFSS
jgi:Transcriptional regulator